VGLACLDTYRHLWVVEAGAFDDGISSQHQRLQGASHPAVTITVGVDHHEVEVGHRRHQHRVRAVAPSQLTCDGGDEIADALRRWTHERRSRAPAPEP